MVRSSFSSNGVGGSITPTYHNAYYINAYKCLKFVNQVIESGFEYGLPKYQHNERTFERCPS